MRLLLLFVSFALASSQDVGARNYEYINPFIGAAHGGNVFAGASLPFSMAKAVADTARDDTGGFAFARTNITGFSAQHDSGTGG